MESSVTSPLASPPVVKEIPTKTLYELRPMSIGELLDRVVYFYRTHFVQLITYSLIFAIPVTILTAGSYLLQGVQILAPDLLIENPGLFAASSLLSLLLSLILSLVSVFIAAFEAAGIAVAAKGFMLESRRVSLREMFSTVRKRAPSLIGIAFVSLFIWIPLAFTLIIPPIGMAAITLYSFSLFLAYSVLMYEERSITESLKRGWLLVCNGGRRILTLLVLYYIFSMFFGMLIVGVLGIGIGIGASVSEDPTWVLLITQPVLMLITQTLMVPLTYGVMSLLYFDLRIRNEGLDVALMAARAAGEPLDLTTAPIIQDTVFGERQVRAVLVLAGIYTAFLVLGCGLFFGLVYITGTL